MPVRLLEASIAASLTVTTTTVLSDVVSTQLDRKEEYEMLDVLTGDVESESNTLAPGFAQPTVPTTTVLSVPKSGSFAYNSDWVNGKEDDEMANDEAVIYGGGEDNNGHVPIENIEVLDWLNDGVCVRVREWMRKEFNYDSDAYDRRVPQNQLEEQTIWWKNNGLSFRLLDLPGELRNLVYIYIIGAVILPKVKATDVWLSQDHSGPIRKDHRLTFGAGNHYPQQRGQARHDSDVEQPNLEILRLCKQVHDEAIGAVWNRSTKRFRDTDSLKNSKLPERYPFMQYANLVSKLSSTQCALNNIQLELSATQLFPPHRDSAYGG